MYEKIICHYIYLRGQNFIINSPLKFYIHFLTKLLSGEQSILASITRKYAIKNSHPNFKLND